MNPTDQAIQIHNMLVQVLNYVQSNAGDKVIEISIDERTSIVVTKDGYQLRVLPSKESK